MKAARTRLAGALSISVKRGSTGATSPGGSESVGLGPGDKLKIQPMTEAEVLSRYKLGGQVMESTNTGMDIIYATRLADNVGVVMKTRKRDSFKSQAQELEWRTTTEYQLNMPKIGTLCQFFEVLVTRKMYYVVMEKVEGRDLFEQMARERPSQVESREIVRQILDALKVMHTSGRIHKDIKIENVMVNMNPMLGGRPTEASEEPRSPVSAKLIDFDTCQDWEPSSPKAKDVLGTDGYIAPEAYSGEYSPASDVYAAGVIMYKLLTKRFPSSRELFDDKPGENYVGSPAMIRIKERLRTEPMNFMLPPFDTAGDARDLVQKMLSFEIERRPSAEECLAHAWFQTADDILSPKIKKGKNPWG